MKQVKNKRYGDVGELDFDSKKGMFIVVFYNLNTKSTVKSYYKSIKELSEEWEDYEELKEYWIISSFGDAERFSKHSFSRFQTQELKTIGNYFETKEEAEQAVEKLKAWKRLKDKGFRFIGVKPNTGFIKYTFYDFLKGIDTAEKHKKACAEAWEDLDLLFGGEDE